MSADDELRRRRKRRALRVPVDEVPRRSAISGFPPAPEPTLAARPSHVSPSSPSDPRPTAAESFDDVEELDAFEEITSELDLGEGRVAHPDSPSSIEAEVPSDELDVEPEVAEALGVREPATTGDSASSIVSEPAVPSEGTSDGAAASETTEASPSEAAVVVVRAMVRVSSMPPPPADDFEAGELADYLAEDAGDELPPLGAEPTRVEDSPVEHAAASPSDSNTSDSTTTDASTSEPSVVVADDAHGDGSASVVSSGDASTEAEPSRSAEPSEAAARSETSSISGRPSAATEASVESSESFAAPTASASAAAGPMASTDAASTDAAPTDAGSTDAAPTETRDSIEELDAAALSTESGETATLDLEPEDDAPELTIEDDEPEPDLDGELDDVDEELDLEEHEAEELAPTKAPAPPVSTAVPAAAAPPTPAEPEAKVEAPPRPDPKPRRRPWFETFFNDDYLRTVRPPKPRDIERECDFITARLNLAPGATILDVGCGLGLHAIELTRRGYLVVGLDLSLPMLSRAGDEAQDLGLKINFLHADMREMNFDGSFDAVLCWGTTFGYFDDDSNKRVVERLHRALKPRGVLLLDVVNRDYVIRSQPNLIWFEGDGCICMEESKFNYFLSRLEVKRTVMLDDGRQRDSVYTLRSYALHELGLLLHQQGFRVAEVSGMTATPGVFFGADSPRILVVAERRVDKKDDPSRPPPPGNPSDG
jgi:SAM-dependent methyltransferase